MVGALRQCAFNFNDRKLYCYHHTTRVVETRWPSLKTMSAAAVIRLEKRKPIIIIIIIIDVIAVVGWQVDAIRSYFIITLHNIITVY